MAEKEIALSRALIVAEMSRPGATISSVAERLSCTPSAIHQAIQNDEKLARDILEAKVKNARDGIELDDKYDKLEKKALDQLEKVLPFVSDPMKLARIAQTMNAAKRRGGAAVEQETGTVVRLTLPNAIKARIELSAKSEVVQVDDRPLVTMPAAQLAEKLKARSAEKFEEKLAQVATFPKIGDIL